MESVIYDSEKARGDIYSYRGPHVDFEDRMLLEDLQDADFSRGGVYFLGSSNMKWSFMNWKLSQGERSLIRNFGIGASNHTNIFQLIEHLVAHEDLLSAGGRKTHVVFGLTYDVALGAEQKSDQGFFPSLWRRRGLHTHNYSDGIRPVRTHALTKFLRTEKSRCSGFFLMLARTVRAKLRLRATYGQPIDHGLKVAAERHDASKYRQALTSYMGKHWQANMVEQVDELRRSVRFLKKRGVGVTVVFLPRGTWDDQLPFNTEYQRQVRICCQSQSIEVVDLSSLLSDEYFADLAHPNPFGQEKLFLPLYHIAQTALKRIRIPDSDESREKPTSITTDQ